MPRLRETAATDPMLSMATRYEYKTLVFEIPRKFGIWTHEPALEELAEIQDALRRMGEEGWMMVGVFPVTDGSSPAQISRAIHYFVRPIDSDPV